MDANNDGSIDWEEFKRAVSKPTTLEAWAQSIPLWQATHSALDQIFLWHENPPPFACPFNRSEYRARLRHAGDARPFFL